MTKISSSIEYSANQITAQWKRNYEFSESQRHCPTKTRWSSVEKVLVRTGRHDSSVPGPGTCDTKYCEKYPSNSAQNCCISSYELGLLCPGTTRQSLASRVQVPPDKAWPLVSRFHPGRWILSRNFSNFSEDCFWGSVGILAYSWKEFQIRLFLRNS